MTFSEASISKSDALDLAVFKEMDYYAVERYALPIELMMENAGLQLANLVADNAESYKSKILIGVGDGNNGGGGLVAARRLAAWGFSVHLDMSSTITKDIPKKQLERALKFGVHTSKIENPDIWVDAYLGFSQRLPLPFYLAERVSVANKNSCLRISLDIPTGFLGDLNTHFFHAHKILTLAAQKKILLNFDNSIEIYLADLGIPKLVYDKFKIAMPSFSKHNILKIIL